jgi:hypothetical protein
LEILTSLVYIHNDLGICYGDLTNENILITKEG